MPVVEANARVRIIRVRKGVFVCDSAASEVRPEPILLGLLRAFARSHGRGFVTAPPVLFRSAAGLGVALGALFAASGCGSSGTTSTAPSPLVRCSLTLNGASDPIPATGGAGSIAVAATRDCTWTVSVDGTWLSLRSSQNGQGDGTVEFAATPNPDPAMRRGALVLNGQRAEITQAAAACVISLAESAASFTPSGGSGRVDVRASSSLCQWSAASDASWIQVRAGADGRGNGSVQFDVAATTGPPRSGTLTIAGQRFSVTQSEGCTYAIAPDAQSVSASGANGTVLVSTTTACPWTAASNVPWITVTPAAGSGGGAVQFNVAPTSGPQRIGTAVIAGNLFTIHQAPGCAYQVQPTAQTIAAGGATGNVAVSAGEGCAWTASSDAPWISILGSMAGAGSGTVTFAVGPTTGPARSGTLTVAGQRVTVSQGQGCSYSVSPAQESIPAAGGAARVTVTAGEGCAWTAASDAPWLSIQSGASGTGNGTVNYSAAPTTGPGRTGTITVAGQRVTVTQGQGCAYAINPSQETVPAAGGGGRVNVTSADGCSWTASSNAPWITITAGASGAGNGAVQYTAAPTTGPARSGTITVAGQTFTVNQGQGCAFTLAPQSADVPNAGGPASFEVQTSAGCGWTAQTQTPWITIASGASGTGTGTVQLTVAANSGAGRTGTVTAGDRTFSVTQGSGCSYALSAPGQSVPAEGGTGTVGVVAPGGCGWTSASNAPWLSITGGATGSGNDTVAFAAAPNSGSPRSGTLTIAGLTFTVTQGESCTFTIAPEQLSPGAAETAATIAVTTTAACAWTAASNASWIAVTSGAGGTGPGNVQLTIAANTGSARTGTATIAGRTLTVNQAAACSFAVTPQTIASAAAGGTERVDVTAASGCAWTAASGATWIGVTTGASGAGDGRVELSVAANTGPARTGTVTVAGQTVTVNQGSGCVFTIDPTSATAPSGGSTGTITVTAGAGCSWSALSRAPWIAVTGGASGTGGGSVQFTVEANPAAAQRTGDILVAGHTFIVTQDKR